MSTEFLPFSKPSLDEETIAEVVDCLRSGWITTGPRVKQFEQMMRDYTHAPFALALSSATAGLHLALLALDLKPGDEVITTPMTFVATLNTIIHAGATPVLVDIEPHTYNINIDLIAQAITSKTKAIIPVHFAGLPVDCDPLYQLAEQHGLHIIEDAAHAIGTEYKGKRIGSFGHSHVFSFHPNKNMTTGEGGCVTTHNEEQAKKIALLRFHGMDREAWNRFGKAGKQDYEIVLPGFKYNMMDIQAAIGIHQLPKIEQFNQRRRDIATRYQKELADWAQWTRPGTPDYDHKHAWHIYSPLLNVKEANIDRATFMTKMKEHNIGTGLHFKAAHLFPYYQQQFGFKPGDFPIAEHVSAHIVSLPLFPLLSDDQQTHIITTMKTIFKR
jgi:dTDP-4-amino-4,6-dideoxygalactose transaminase